MAKTAPGLHLSAYLMSSWEHLDIFDGMSCKGKTGKQMKWFFSCDHFCLGG